MILNELFEARQTHPEIEYKEKKVKGVLDRVIALLSGNKSGAFTRIAQRYKRIDRLAKLMKDERDALNKEVKAKILPLFDAQDEIYTRVIETASLTITLSRVQSGSNEYLDIESYVEELEKLMPGMEKQIEALRKQFTIVEEFEKDSALRVKVKEDESEDRLTQYASRAAAMISAHTDALGAKLDSLKQHMAADGLLNNPQLDEISKETLKSYIGKTNAAAEDHASARDYYRSTGDNDADARREDKKYWKRRYGQSRAYKKLAAKGE